MERERYERLRAAMADGMYDRRVVASRAVGAAAAGYDIYGGDRYADYPRENMAAAGAATTLSAVAVADYYSRSAYPPAAAMPSSAGYLTHH